MLKKTNDFFYSDTPTKRSSYREPLPDYQDYACWVSKSGFMGANAAFRRNIIKDCPLAFLYSKEYKGIVF